MTLAKSLMNLHDFAILLLYILGDGNCDKLNGNAAVATKGAFKPTNSYISCGASSGLSEQ